MAEEKELTVDGNKLAEQDPAVVANEPVEPPKSAIEGMTAQDVHGERLPEEVKTSGVGVGYVSGADKRGTPMGIRGEQEDFRGSSITAKK
jgi:hypothetical protein